jgi:tetratricopeptide (TPR) repeat protein
MTWKQLQQRVRDRNGDFSKLLAQNFLLLHQRAKDKKDTASIQTLKVIVSGLIDLTKAIEERKAVREPALGLSSNAYTLFFRLAESYNNPSLVKQAGLHYLMEWRLPEVALHHFERALALGGSETAMRSLIDVASLAVQRKNAPKKGTSADTGVTISPAANSNARRIIQQTNKLLITKTQRPSPQAMPVIARTLRAKTTAALPEAIKECLKEAGRELANGNLSRVRELLLRAGKHPVKKEILRGMWSNLGRACYKSASYVGMEEAYTQAYIHDPKGDETYFDLALAKSLNHKMEEAEKLYQLACKLAPSSPKVWFHFGVFYFQNDRFKEAEAAFRCAVKYQPESARAWDNLASALSAQGKADAAIEACQKAIQLRPGYPEAYFKLSAIYFGRGDPASLTVAASALSYVVNHPPLAASANALLSMIQSRLEQIDSAKASLQRVVESDPKCILLPSVWNELETAIRAS